MAEEDTDIPLDLEINEAEGSSQEACFDIPVIAVAEINEPEDVVTEESIDISVIVEVNEPKSSNVIVIGDFSTPRCRPKILSRYLLPPTGSCHDFCKYGMKQSFEGKPQIPLLRKVKSDGCHGRDLKRATILLAKQNKHAISLKSSSYNKCQISINNNDLKEDVISAPKIVTLSTNRLLLPIKEVKASVVNCSGIKRSPSQSKRSSFDGQDCLRTKSNKQIGKGKEQEGDADSCINSTSRCRTNSSIEEDMKAFVQPAVSSTPRNCVKRVVKADKNIIGRFRLRNQSRPIKVKPIEPNDVDVPEKTLYVIEQSTENGTNGLAQNSVHTIDLSQPQSSSAADNNLSHDPEVDQTPKVPQLSAKENMRCARKRISSKILFTSSSVPWGFKGLRHKKLGITSTQSSPPSSSSSKSPPSSSSSYKSSSFQSSSKSPSQPIYSKHGTSGNDVKKSGYSKMQHKSKPQREGIINSDNGDCQSRRLKFRKGRVVDLQPENNAPRRLKFRHVRLLGETKNSKSDLRKRSIQSKEANHNGDEAKETENIASRRQDQEFKRKKIFRRKEFVDSKYAANRIKSEKVVLRRQDSKVKKEIQSLLNNVIEETATKLEQTRKSKVKALVGAFETVISLQDTDTKPSATVSA